MVTKITSAIYKEVKAELNKRKAPAEISKKFKIGVSTVHRIQHSKSFKHYQEHYTGKSQDQVKKTAEKKLEKELNKVACPKLSIESVKEHLETQISNTRASIMSIVDELCTYELVSKIAIVLAVVALVLAIIK